MNLRSFSQLLEKLGLEEIRTFFFSAHSTYEVNETDVRLHLSSLISITKVQVS